MAEPLNQASTPTLQGTMPELQKALEQAAIGLPNEALQQALGMAGAFGPDLAAVQNRRETELKPSMAQAEAASKQYEQLAASAPPQVSGAQAGLNELLGSVASILSGNQGYRETAAQRLQKEQQALLDSRSQNLTRLKDLYDKRAEAAKSLGNDIAEEENRIKKDRLEKSLEVINNARAQQYEMEQLRAREGSLKQERQMQQLINQAQIRWQGQNTDMTNILDYRNQIMQTSNDSVGDLLMLRFLARISDPRTGVREQEFETFKRAEGELKRVFNAPRSWFGQGMLTDEGRRALRAEAEKMFRQKLQSYDARLKSTRDMYIRQGMSPADAESAIYDAVNAYRGGVSGVASQLGLGTSVYGGMGGNVPAVSDTAATGAGAAKPAGVPQGKLAELKRRKR